MGYRRLYLGLLARKKQCVRAHLGEVRLLHRQAAHVGAAHAHLALSHQACSPLPCLRPTATLPCLTCRITYGWIKSQIEQEEAQAGFDKSKYAHSMVVGTLKPTDLGTLRQADGKEAFQEKN